MSERGDDRDRSDPPAGLTARQSADRQSRTDLSDMWSGMAHEDEQYWAAHIPTLLSEADRQSSAARHEVGRLRLIVQRMRAVGIADGEAEPLLALIEELEVAINTFREGLPK